MYIKIFIKSLLKGLALLLFVYYVFIATASIEFALYPYESPAVNSSNLISMPFEYFFSYPAMLIKLTGPSVMLYIFTIGFLLRDIKRS